MQTTTVNVPVRHHWCRIRDPSERQCQAPGIMYNKKCTNPLVHQSPGRTSSYAVAWSNFTHK